MREDWLEGGRKNYNCRYGRLGEEKKKSKWPQYKKSNFLTVQPGWLCRMLLTRRGMFGMSVLVTDAAMPKCGA